MLNVIPLTILPWIAFNVVGYIFPDIWSQKLFQVTLMSSHAWSFTFGDLMILAGLGCLFFEVLRSTSSNSRIITNHILSTVVLILFLIEFIVVPFAAESVFFILMAMALFDVMAGFTITIKSAQRDISYNRTTETHP